MAEPTWVDPDFSSLKLSERASDAWVDLYSADELILDGSFTPADLRALADWAEGHRKPLASH